MKRLKTTDGKIFGALLDNGTIITVSDLPDPRAYMTAQRKATLVRCLLAGVISEAELLIRYEMSPEELQAMIAFYAKERETGFKRPFNYDNPRSNLARERRETVRKMRAENPNVSKEELTEATGLSIWSIREYLKKEK